MRRNGDAGKGGGSLRNFLLRETRGRGSGSTVPPGRTSSRVKTWGGGGGGRSRGEGGGETRRSGEKFLPIGRFTLRNFLPCETRGKEGERRVDREKNFS